MDKINKTVRYNALFSIYQELLTSTQKDIMNLYFAYDLSLSEISEERKISRSAVDDAIKKSIAKLEELESTLHLYEKKMKIIENTSKLKQSCIDKEQMQLIDDIERNL